MNLVEKGRGEEREEEVSLQRNGETTTEEITRGRRLKTSQSMMRRMWMMRMNS